MRRGSAERAYDFYLDSRAAGTDVIAMSIRATILALALAAVALGATAQAAVAQVTDPNALAPYRFQPPPATLSPLEQQKALNYRSQVQSQLRQLEQRRTLSGPSSIDPRALMDTRRELDRMNGVVQP
jgi:hypothetical protein